MEGKALKIEVGNNTWCVLKCLGIDELEMFVHIAKWQWVKVEVHHTKQARQMSNYS